MVHHNACGQEVPDHLWNIALSVKRHVSSGAVFEHWRGQVRSWCQRYTIALRVDGKGDTLDRRPAEYAPLPFELELCEKYAVLSAIYDFAGAGDAERLGPPGGDVMDATVENVAYDVLLTAVQTYSPKDADRLLTFLEELKRKPVKKMKAKRGPKGPRYDAKADARVYDAWKASGYSKIEPFALKLLGADTRRAVKVVRDRIDRERKRRSRKVRK